MVTCSCFLIPKAPSSSYLKKLPKFKTSSYDCYVLKLSHFLELSSLPFSGFSVILTYDNNFSHQNVGVDVQKLHEGVLRRRAPPLRPGHHVEVRPQLERSLRPLQEVLHRCRRWKIVRCWSDSCFFCSHLGFVCPLDTAWRPRPEGKLYIRYYPGLIFAGSTGLKSK